MYEKSQQDPSELAAWSLRVTDIGKNGRDVRYSATPDERAAVTAALDLVALDTLLLTGKLRLLSKGRVGFAGRLVAEVVQACVVSLEPVPGNLDIAIDVEFWPEDDIATSASASFDALGGSDPEPIEGETLQLGRLAYETLGANLDPYPRKAGASLDPQVQQEPASAARNNPFAVLGKLKPKL
jgi:hypothetical protein